LLGDDLDLRELQRTGRIGRIQVEFESSGGQSSGKIIIPSNLDRVETAILAATIESVDRVGPCNAEMKIESISDAREDKRKQIVGRATELLKKWESDVSPDAVEITEGIKDTLRVEEIRSYGKEQLPAGPAVDESEEIVIVEGRADVLACLRYGVKNCIAVQGTKIPKTIIDLCKQKSATVFLDGDRGGDMILNELLQVTDVDAVARAPAGLEVEQLTQKQFMKALQSKISVDELKAKMNGGQKKKKEKEKKEKEKEPKKPLRGRKGKTPPPPRGERKSVERAPPAEVHPPHPPQPPIILPQEVSARMKGMVGTNEAVGFDGDFKEVFVTGTSALMETLKNATAVVKMIIFDGIITQRILSLAIEKKVELLLGINTSGKIDPKSVKIYFFKDFF
jgi:DNA primase